MEIALNHPFSIPPFERECVCVCGAAKTSNYLLRLHPFSLFVHTNQPRSKSYQHQQQQHSSKNKASKYPVLSSPYILLHSGGGAITMNLY